MSLRKRVEGLERAARQRPAPAPPAWTGSEEERLRLVMELFALGRLRLQQAEEEQYGETVPRSVVEAMSDDELLAILGFPSMEAFACAEERYRIEQARRPKLSPEEERRRVNEVLRARRAEV